MECNRCYKRYCDACEKKCKSFPTDEMQNATVCECGHYLTMTERTLWKLFDMVEKWKNERNI